MAHNYDLVAVILIFVSMAETIHRFTPQQNHPNHSFQISLYIYISPEKLNVFFQYRACATGKCTMVWYT